MNYAAKRTRTIGCTRCTSRLICHGARSLPSSCRDRLIDLRRTTPDLYADATTERNVGKILGRNESGDYAHRESFARIRIILFYFTLFLLRNRERISFFLFLSPLFLNFETILFFFSSSNFPLENNRRFKSHNLCTQCIEIQRCEDLSYTRSVGGSSFARLSA